MLGFLEYVISTTNSPLFCWVFFQVKRAYRGGSDGGFRFESWLVNWCFVVVGVGFLDSLERTFHKAAERLKYTNRENQAAFFLSFLCPKWFFSCGRNSAFSKDVLLCTVLFGSRVFFEEHQQRTTLQGALFWTTSDSPTPTPPKQGKMIQYSTILIFKFRLFSTPKQKQWNFVSVVGVHWTEVIPRVLQFEVSKLLGRVHWRCVGLNGHGWNE